LELWNKEKKANLLLINGNPLENLEFVKNPETIFLNGTIILKLNTKKRNLFSWLKKIQFPSHISPLNQPTFHTNLLNPPRK
jgi:hypothetical protein